MIISLGTVNNGATDEQSNLQSNLAPIHRGQERMRVAHMIQWIRNKRYFQTSWVHFSGGYLNTLKPVLGGPN